MTINKIEEIKNLLSNCQTCNSICSLDRGYNKICLPNDLLVNIKNKLNIKDETVESNEIINLISKKLNYSGTGNKEIFIINNLGDNIIDKNKIKNKYFKVYINSFSSTHWLNNIHIDESQKILSKLFKNYYYSYIHMIDFVMIRPDNNSDNIYPIYNIDFSNEIKNNRMEYYGVIFNTDISTGGGKHWFSVFMDFSLSNYDYYRIEYFNSSGNNINNTKFNEFFENLALSIHFETKIKCIFTKVSNIQHQSVELKHYNSGNCGMYSLYYIYSRLLGIKSEYFDDPKNIITDDEMTKFREYLFRNEH